MIQIKDIERELALEVHDMLDVPKADQPVPPILRSRSDVVSGCVVGSVGALCTLAAWRLPFGTLRAPDAGFFPISLSILLTGIGLLIAARSLARKNSALVEFPAEVRNVGLTALTLVAYAAGLERIGYVLGTSIVLLFLTRFLGAMTWGRSVLIVVPGVFISYFGFRQLGVPLPAGVLPF